MKTNNIAAKVMLRVFGFGLLVVNALPVISAPAQVPLFLGGGQPLVMLTMSRDHKLYYEAYNDASDINGDGIPDVGFKESIDYYGYFDSYKCYTYSSSYGRFVPASVTANKKCSGQWSGNFLNYVSMTRMDAIRKVLYGGYRQTDSNSSSDSYLTVLQRSFVPQEAHSWGKEYESVARDGYDITQYTPLSLPSAGKRHLFANTTLLGTTNPLMRVLADSSYRVWEWLSIERPVAGSDCDNGSGRVGCGSITDYVVRVEVCKVGLLESDCRSYPRGSASPTNHKPSGLLHEFGEDHSMAFGLLTGSYTHNLQGGVLRKNIENFSNEIDAATGQFNSSVGIVKTIDSLTVTGFGGSYEYSCGWITTRPINDGECKMWGNPLGEMMYEALRYLAGQTANSSYTYTGNDDGLNLPQPAWQNPYRTGSGGYGWCSKPFQLVISDVYPSYDSDLPGSSFGTFSGTALTGYDIYSGTSQSIDVSILADTIWNKNYESEATNLFVGHSKAGGVDNYDGAPTAKNVSSFATIRGLAPNEPTKQGTYYAASVAYFGNKNRITDPQSLPANGKRQNVQTFAVALASHLPTIEIPGSGTQKITLVPFAKSVGGSSISNATGSFQPTNQIVDFYIDTIRNVSGFPTDAAVNGGRPYYKFRINYEDVEQGADHDMDAIVEYTIQKLASGDIEVKLDSTYAAGGIIQHMGYVVSGSTADGTYLVVRDKDTAAGSDPDYFLDVPNTAGVALPLTSTRTFSFGSTASASFIKHDPLWYAAKWGGFTDTSSSQNNFPDVTSEWDKKNSNGTTTPDGVPDNYFLVTNAGQLKDQLRSAFSEIAARTTSASAIAQNSTRLDTDTMIYQARFNTQDWTGQLRAFQIQTDGTVSSTPTWEASAKMPAHGSRNIYTWNNAAYAGNLFKLSNPSLAGELTAAQLTALALNTLPASDQVNMINYLRGDSSNEQQNGGIFRNRSASLGDIVNSDPVYVFAEDFGYESLPESIPALATDPNTYAYFRDNDKPLRRKMIYVSSNDGIVHGFDASNTNSGGVEQFAFVPAAVLSSAMKGLASPNYTHQYLVDGPLAAGDAYVGGSWKTVLIGTTGAGNAGKSVFALDITNPDSFSASNVMWEFSSIDLGFPMGVPVVARMPNGRWAAVLGNGWESSVDKARLIIVYLDPVLTGASPGWTAGTDYCVLTTDETLSNNGLGSPSLIDTNGDGIIDFAYAGDLQGNLWRFKFDSSTGDCPNTGGSPAWKMDKKIFQTPSVTCKQRSATGVVSNCTSPVAKRQSITAPLEVGGPPAGQTGYTIYFGTGSYYQSSDVSDMTEQAFYGVWDNLSSAGAATTALVSLSDLVQQTIDSQGTVSVTNANPPPATLSYDYRTTSANAITYPTKKGWYMKLLTPNPTASTPSYDGERVVSAPLLRAGRVVFATLIPSTDACSFGGDSWIMEIDASTGAATSTPSFDLNNDGGFTSADKVGGSIVGGIKSSEGIVKTPAVISAGGVEYKYASGTTGNIQKVIEKGTAAVKRTSWRQLQ